MNTQQIISKAYSLHKLFRKRGWMRMNELIYVTHETWKALDHHPAQSYCRTRTFKDNAFKEDFDAPSSAHVPVVKETWIGARSLECLHSPETLAQEDQAECSEYTRILYHDAETGETLIDDPVTGERRPLRAGDVIATARGSNDDLDALFQDEPNDPRPDRDALITDLFPGAADYMEDTYVTDTYDDLVLCKDGTIRLAQFRNDEAAFHRDAIPCLAEPDELALAIEAASFFGDVPLTQSQIDAGVTAIREAYAKDFVTAERYWEAVDKCARMNIEAIRCKKAAPRAIDWNVLRSPAEQRKRAKALKSLRVR